VKTAVFPHPAWPKCEKVTTWHLALHFPAAAPFRGLKFVEAEESQILQQWAVSFGGNYCNCSCQMHGESIFPNHGAAGGVKFQILGVAFHHY